MQLLPDALSTFLYTCVATAETMEPAATPITDPAMPIFADSRNEVTAASAPAKIDENDMPLKNSSQSMTVADYALKKLAIL